MGGFAPKGRLLRALHARRPKPRPPQPPAAQDSCSDKSHAPQGVNGGGMAGAAGRLTRATPPQNTNLPILIGAETTEAKEASEGATAPDRATERGRARHPPTKHKRRFRVLPPSSPSHTATILDVVNGLLSLHVSCGRWWLCGGMGFGRIFQPPKSPFSLKKTKKSRFFLKKAKKEVPVFGT